MTSAIATAEFGAGEHGAGEHGAGENGAPATPILVLSAAAYPAWRRDQDPMVAAWLDATGFEPKPGARALVPDPAGRRRLVLQIVDEAGALWTLAGASETLPQGLYTIAGSDEGNRRDLVLGWLLGAYAFERYKPRKRAPARLVWPDGVDRPAVEGLADAIGLARDLINTPAEAMGPAELAEAAAGVSQRFPGTAITIIEGDQLLAANYPLIHAVGRASARAPRLIDVRWARPDAPADAPRVTLVGKGVCFDSGGLDLKPAAGMRIMKKDMGGAATALGLAQAIMAAGLGVRLRVLIPAVENAVSGRAFRPLDVFRSRKGLSVEIGNTDAEGRLILADALAEACTEKPAVLIDFATLTGAARTALGPDLPALFTPDEDLARDLLAAGADVADPMWRLPLWQPYRKMIESRVADLDNAGEGGMAGAITAALFLESFVETGTAWAHIDTYAWNPKPRPGRPEGGEALTLRAVFHYLSRRFAGL